LRLDDLSERIAREFLHHEHFLWNLVRRELRLAKLAQLRSRRFALEDDERGDLLVELLDGQPTTALSETAGCDSSVASISAG